MTMSMSTEEIENRYPIHWLVWNNRHEELKKALDSKKFMTEELESKDPRGRTPLLLAVTLAHVECVKALVEAGADVNCEKDGWTAVQEATATGDAELLSLVLGRRDFQRHVLRSGGVPELLQRLSLAPDFYVEMKWEFTSWVPLVSRMCPFDTYKVYKRGANVRVDTTLVGFENNRWQRGDRTYIFTGQGNAASLIELDHERNTVWCSHLDAAAEAAWPAPSAHSVQQRLAQPIAINYLDTDKISFERNKCGIWGWRQDKTELVNGYSCVVWGAHNVELVSATRREHLASPATPAPPAPGPRAPLQPLLALTNSEPEEVECPAPAPAPSRPLTAEEYFSEQRPEGDIGRPRHLATKVQKFKATLWLCEDYPLQLQEQIMPILDLMASMSSPHFAKLKDFIQMQLPAGFPVKIEIPLFHVLNARITFGNIFGTETPVPHVQSIEEGDRISAVIDDACFAIPPGYKDATALDDRHCGLDDEEGLLQYAIQQSLMESGTQDDQVDVWEALRGARPVTPSPRSASPNLLNSEERQLQRAIEASLASLSVGPQQAAPAPPPIEDDLQAALALSAQEHSRLESELLEEQRALDEAIRLSLLDK
ncbi:hypothetical protein JYU34_005960 [Plutella xylostella]|uniref:Ankyrin repeat domain-containing protein n=1 Tax=Plutella xylostella TaxID=51655 RepID=A0ABQ7QUP0_PLUXY|nr:hypothetical protein JYU34_005960 [Plutella xylostella]